MNRDANPGTGSLSLSPDDRQLVFGRRDPQMSNDLWIESRQILSRFSFGGNGRWPVWSADGRHLAFVSTKDGVAELIDRVLDGSQKERLVMRLTRDEHPIDWSPDGRMVVLQTVGTATGWDLVSISLPEGQRGVLVQTAANEIQGRLSRDGRWFAYSSDESGRWEVYVQPFPFTGSKWRVSADGGSQPNWRGDGNELMFLGADLRLMAVDVATAPTFAAGLPHALFETRMRATFEPYPFEYAMTADGQRFALKSHDPGAITVSVASNWAAALKD